MSKDKRMTIRQTMHEIHKAYDFIEKTSVEAIEASLREVFGFGDKRVERFKAAYLDKFGEAVAAECERIEAQMRRKV